jgi:hypothetical protein
MIIATQLIFLLFKNSQVKPGQVKKGLPWKVNEKETVCLHTWGRKNSVTQMIILPVVGLD